MEAIERPPVDIANNVIPEYYKTHGPELSFMQKLHKACSAVFHPTIYIEDGTRAAVDQHLDEGKPIVYSLSHASWYDPLVDAAVVHKVQPLSRTIGEIVIPANAQLFNGPVGGIITRGGAKPVIRPKDTAKAAGTYSAEDRKATNSKQLSMLAEYVNTGLHTAFFPEGTRNKGNRRTLQPLRGGIIKLINMLDQAEDALIVLMSISYGDKRTKNIFHPTVAIGHMAVENAAEITINDIQAKQQELLDIAYIKYDGRPAAVATRALQSIFPV